MYILTGSRTGAGAEEFAYVLRRTGRATLVGEATVGAAHPGDVVSLHPQLEVFVPTGRSVVPFTGGNWEGGGVEPHVRA